MFFIINLGIRVHNIIYLIYIYNFFCIIIISCNNFTSSPVPKNTFLWIKKKEKKKIYFVKLKPAKRKCILLCIPSVCVNNIFFLQQWNALVNESYAPLNFRRLVYGPYTLTQSILLDSKSHRGFSLHRDLHHFYSCEKFKGKKSIGFFSWLNTMQVYCSIHVM